MKISKLKLTLVSLTAGVLLQSAHGAIIVSVDDEAPNGDPHVGISATSGDLLETQLMSVDSTGSLFNTSNPANEQALTNGSISTATDNTGIFKGGVGETITFNLDVSTNTLGYDITSIATYSFWTDGRADQDYTVSFSAVGSSDFTLFSYNLAEVNLSNRVSEVVLTDNSSGMLLASGVDAIQFVFDDVTEGATDDSNNRNWAGYREIDVIGSATIASIPEPSSLFLLGLSGLVLATRRRR